MKRLTECEEIVMKVIWDSDDRLNLPQIVENANRQYGKNWAMQTVSTFLARLRKKNVVVGERCGRTFYYEAIMTKEAYATKVTKDLCAFWFESNPDKMMDALKSEITKEDEIC